MFSTTSSFRSGLLLWLSSAVAAACTTFEPEVHLRVAQTPVSLGAGVPVVISYPGRDDGPDYLGFGVAVSELDKLTKPCRKGGPGDFLGWGTAKPPSVPGVTLVAEVVWRNTRKHAITAGPAALRQLQEDMQTLARQLGANVVYIQGTDTHAAYRLDPASAPAALMNVTAFVYRVDCSVAPGAEGS